ncbi:hypothetical protein Syun_003618 [Stephania yunnanensis]|uniref:Uncharacterized protein n=1 Tax=Stephania yunnanensis TaxID=152371 RepID=A0AAP0Q428_9MAGN
MEEYEGFSQVERTSRHYALSMMAHELILYRNFTIQRIYMSKACAFRDSYEKFKKAGAKVIGISGDDSASHKGKVITVFGIFRRSLPLFPFFCSGVLALKQLPRGMFVLPHA